MCWQQPVVNAAYVLAVRLPAGKAVVAMSVMTLKTLEEDQVSAQRLPSDGRPGKAVCADHRHLRRLGRLVHL